MLVVDWLFGKDGRGPRFSTDKDTAAKRWKDQAGTIAGLRITAQAEERVELGHQSRRGNRAIDDVDIALDWAFGRANANATQRGWAIFEGAETGEGGHGLLAPTLAVPLGDGFGQEFDAIVGAQGSSHFEDCRASVLRDVVKS